VESLQMAMNVVVPMFLMLALGCLLRRIGMFDQHTLDKMNDVCFKVFMAPLLYYNIYTARTPIGESGRMLLFAVVSELLLFTALWIITVVIEKENPRRAALLQGLFRTNAVLFCTAIGTSILGEGNIGPISLLVSVVVPLYNVLTVIELEIFRGGKIKPGKIALGVLKNPYIVAAILGYLTVALRIQLPVPVVTSLRDITRCSTPVALMVLGGLFNFGAVRGNLRNIIVGVAGRLVIVPAIMLPITIWMGFRGVELVGLMGMFVAPTAVASFNMAHAMDADYDLAGHLVVFGTMFSVVTIFFWVFGLGYLGFI